MSRFKNREQFITAQSSEKITLATFKARKRVFTWSDEGSGVYSRNAEYFVSNVHNELLPLAQVGDIGSVIEDSFFYDIKNGILYIKLSGSQNPAEVEIILTFTLFYSSKSVQIPHNLEDISTDVHWEGRIQSSPGYKHKIGIDQALTSLIGEGTMVLFNNDGGLDRLFDRLIFENQECVVYSWNPDLKPSERRVVWRGRVTNKFYNRTQVKFKIKDELYALLDSPSLDPYSSLDNVSDSAVGQYKRRIYGRVDGLRCQSVDQIGNGYAITGAVGGDPTNAIIFGTGTQFLNEVKQGDKLNVESQSFTVTSITSDTVLFIDNEPEYAFTNALATLVPEGGSTTKNRRFQAAGHACAAVTHNVVLVNQFNRIVLDSTEGLFEGDFIEIVETAERLEIKNTAPGNIVVLRQNMSTKPSIGSQIIRQPIQEVYIKDRRVNSDDYIIDNSSAGCYIDLDEDVEFNLARPQNTQISATFAIGSKIVTLSATDVSVDEILQSGDYIKPKNVTYPTYYKISSIDDDTNTIRLTTNFSDPSITDIINFKRPEVVTDDTIVSVNILGKTVDGEPSGQWITTAAQVERDILRDIGLNEVNEQSFVDGSQIANQLISMAIPANFTNKSIPNAKSIIDSLNKSVRSSLTLDNNLQIKYQTLLAFTEENMLTIYDRDVKEWSINTVSGKLYQTVNSKYRYTDVDLSTQEPGNKLFGDFSEFIDKYIGTSQVDEQTLYLYEDVDAQISTHRHLYYNRLGFSTLNVETDLRLEDVEIGQPVIIAFDRMYQQFGSAAFRYKVMLVVGKTLSGESTNLELSDLGNVFNTSSIITKNDAPDYATATDVEKLVNGFITDNNGITEDDENSAGIHLIS